MRALTALVVVVALAGCGHAAPATHTATPAAVPARYRDLAVCWVYDHGSDVALFVTASDAGAACWKTVRTQAAAGEYWSVTTSRPPTVASQQAPYCSMVRGGASVEVFDSGGATGGQRVCANLQAQGYTEGEAGD